MTRDAVGQQPMLNTSICTAEPVNAADDLQLLCMYVMYACMYVCMYVCTYARQLANIGRQPRGAALHYQKELASGNEIGRRTEQRCYLEKQ